MRNILTLLALCIAATFAAAPLYGQSVPAEDVKAAMVLNFIRFTSFSSERETISLCVSADHPGLAQLRALEDRLAGASRIRVKVLQRASALTSEQCQVAVFGEICPLTQAALSVLTRSGVLTIGDGADFIDHGGVIQFFNESSRVRFEIDNKTARSAGINISSKVLALARVRERHGKGD